LKRDLDSAARFQASPTGQPQSAPAASDAARAGNRVNAKTPPTVPVIVHAATPQRSPAAEDDAGAGSATNGKISVHLPISYPIETVPEITGIPRTKIFEAVRTKKLTARKIGRSTIIERSELERFIRALPTKGRPPDAAAPRTDGGNPQ
jgi:hypothetical protein